MTTSPLGTDVTGDVRSKIPSSIQNLLWGRAAGRCEFAGCNEPLWKSDVTQETRNIAEKAHIRAYSLGGPRADPEWLHDAINELDNLILLCHGCHVTVDRMDGPARYTADMLHAMKRRHEDRIEAATAVAPDLSSHIVTYGTFIGEHQALPTFADARQALFPKRYPASRDLFVLGTPTSPRRDHTPDYWREERQQLRYQFDRVRASLERGTVAHLSVFALAPQPLLVDLGNLLGDLTPADIYQRHREPQTWSWPEETEDCDFQLTSPADTSGPPALVLSVSATIAHERVTACLGGNACIWTVTVPLPHNDILKSREAVAAFRVLIRRLMDRIKLAHGHQTPLHVFPALPVALAVELGRARMPKADMPWKLYDEHQGSGGFAHAFTIDSNGAS